MIEAAKSRCVILFFIRALSMRYIISLLLDISFLFKKRVQQYSWFMDNEQILNTTPTKHSVKYNSISWIEYKTFYYKEQWHFNWSCKQKVHLTIRCTVNYYYKNYSNIRNTSIQSNRLFFKSDSFCSCVFPIIMATVIRDSFIFWW